jgi:phosphatidylserine/phosphatidylglycerophosphate/cardiolipin synthase-like enzyme
MLRYLSLFLFLAGPVFSSERSDELSTLLSKKYQATLDLDRIKLEISQNVKIEGCKIHLLTENEFGVLARDIYDLAKVNVHKREKSFKGTEVLAFGIKSILKERSFLHFNSWQERENVYPDFKELSELCKSEVIQKPGSSDEGEIIPEFTQGVNLALLRKEDSFIERLKAVRGAKKNLYLTQLFIRGDEVGILFTEEIIKKRMEGLDVRVVVTPLFNVIKNKDPDVIMKNSQIALKNMMAAGIRVHGLGCSGFIKNEVRGLDLGKFLRPNHVKNWIIDGELSISGGINISERYFLLGSKFQWLDQDIEAQGPIVKEMEKRFLKDFWEKEIHYKTYKQDDKCLNPFDPKTEKENYLEFKETHTHPYISTRNSHEIAENKYVHRNLEKILAGKRELKLVDVTRSKYLMDRPDEGEMNIMSAYIDLINAAKEEILLANAFGLFVPEIKLALRQAIARGVKVVVLTNDPETDKGDPIVNTLARSFYIDFVLGDHDQMDPGLDPRLILPLDGVEIHEWQGLKYRPVHVVLHAKYMVVDRKIGLVGSFNMDYASLKNLEQAVIFESPELAGELFKLFQEDLQSSKKLSVEEIKSFFESPGSKILFLVGKMLRKKL